MKIVKIYQFDTTKGQQELLATCRLRGDRVVCQGDQKFIDNLEFQGIRDYVSDTPKILFFEDGLRFLEQMQFNFKSGYIIAGNIEDVEEE